MPNPPEILQAYSVPAYVGQSEDCLFLNVWAPEGGGLLPVMVWLHDGGFVIGSGSYTMEQGRRMAHDHNVVVVSLNHRLAALGFVDFSRICGPGFEDADNLGMRDIVLALQWVQTNIAAFGGDPSNVTIFGLSGGGMKVSTLLGMPQACGLFHRAIIQSGPLLRGLTRGEADTVASALMAQLGIERKHANQLRRMPFERILAAQDATLRAVPTGEPFLPSGFSPVVDGATLPGDMFDPAASASSLHVPLLIGQTRSEFALFSYADRAAFFLSGEQFRARAASLLGPELASNLLPRYERLYPGRSPSQLWFILQTDFRVSALTATIADRRSVQGAAPVFAYMFEWKTPAGGGALGAHHGLDVPFIFETVNEAGKSMTGGGLEVERLARAYSGAWAAFARTGNPDTGLFPNWPQYDARTRAAMHIDVVSSVQPFVPAEILEPLQAVRFGRK